LRKEREKPRVLARQLTVGTLVIALVVLVAMGFSVYLLGNSNGYISSVSSLHQPLNETVESLTRNSGWRLFVSELLGEGFSPDKVGEIFGQRGRLIRTGLNELRAMRPSCGGCHEAADPAVVSWYDRFDHFEAVVKEQEALVARMITRRPVDRNSLISALSPLMIQGIALADSIGAPMRHHTNTLDAMALLRMERTRFIILGVSLFAFLSIVVVVLYIDHALRRPVNGLLEGTARLAAGELSHRVPAGQQDEFGYLAESFNQMATRLEQEDAELRHEKEELHLAHQELESAYGQLQANAIEVEEAHQELEAAYGQLQAQTVELEISNQRLEQANKVKSAFISMVSHELRTPLSVIRGYLNLILEDDFGSPGSELKQILGVAEKRSRQLQYLIEEILDLTQIEAGELKINRKPSSLREIIADVLDVYSEEIERKGVSCTTELSDDFPVVRIDQGKMGQVFANLVDNAIKFSPVGGRIRIRCALEEGEVLCTVSDQGPGIPKESLDRIFEPFFQVDPSDTRSHGGIGLGLTIVHEVIRGHGGKVTVDSTEGGTGTTFTLRFPATGDEFSRIATAMGHPEPTPAPPLPRELPGLLRMLVVEDDRDMASILSGYLSDKGIAAKVVGNPLEALAAALAEEYDMVLLDVMLPTLNGFDLSRIFKAMTRTSGWPLILMSAAAQKFHVEEGLRTGADAFIAKPFEFDELYSKIREVYDLRQ
jgi:signal transduction histidine kinase/CheY-like chemotaxis protein